MAVTTHLQIEFGEYDAKIRTFIPRYEEMLDAAVAALGAADRPIRTVVDLGTGTGALAERVLRRVKRARVVGIDADRDMLALASRRLPARRTTLCFDNFLRASLPAADAVIASFSLHHVEHHRDKRSLYRRVRSALRPGGVLVTADCQPSSHATLAAAGRTAWRDHLAGSYGRTKAEGFLRAWSHEDFYVPLDVELSLMRAAGLAPEVTWRRDAFAVIVAAVRD